MDLICEYRLATNRFTRMRMRQWWSSSLFNELISIQSNPFSSSIINYHFAISSFFHSFRLSASFFFLAARRLPPAARLCAFVRRTLQIRGGHSTSSVVAFLLNRHFAHYIHVFLWFRFCPCLYRIFNSIFLALRGRNGSAFSLRVVARRDSARLGGCRTSSLEFRRNERFGAGN